MSYVFLKSFPKINIHLGVVGKNKRFHKIESIVSFCNIFDLILIKSIKKKKHQIKFYGKFSKGIGKRNTVSNLLDILDKENLLNGKKYSIKITKKIPQKSGLGGGSMNAATLLKYFINKKKFNLTNNQLMNVCNKIGSDVALGLSQKVTLLKSDGSLTRINKKLPFHLILIRPNFGCKTSSIFKGVKNFSKKKLYKKKKFDLKNLKNLKNLSNDLEIVSYRKYPVLTKIKDSLLTLKNVSFVRMSGSGSTLVGYFRTRKDALDGTKILKKKYKKYWCILTKTI